MSRVLSVLLIVTVAFSGLSTVALVDVGYFGIIEPHFKSWGAAQVFWDLVIVCALAIVWMIRDARERAANPWPFVVLTLVAGSFGPLSYLIVREVRRIRQNDQRTGHRGVPQGLST